MEKQLGAPAFGFGDGGLGLALCEVEIGIVSGLHRLFGTDGVRGVAGKPPLQKPLVKQLGAAAARIYRRQTKIRHPVFLLGRDTRLSGAWIARAFAEGAGSEGARMVDVGVVSTPSLAYLVPREHATGGVMISASHNPAEFNGIKLFGPTGRKCPDAWEQSIEQDVSDHRTVPSGPAHVRKQSRLLQHYLAFLKTTLPPHFSLKGMTLVVDCSHGSLSKIAPPFLRKLGAKVLAIGASPNGRNINDGIGSQHPAKMQKLVIAKKAHGGLAFDGDADRIVLCDEKGRLLDGDHVLACAAHVLKEEDRLSGNRVVVTVMANLGLMKALAAWGINADSTPVGDRYVSERLEKSGGVIGGEQSGHIIFHDYLPTGDGLLTGLQILAMLRARQRPLSWMHSLITKYPQVLLNVHVREKRPLDQCPAIQQAISAAERALADQGRVVVRYSGTEPLLRIMMEGPDHTELQRLAQAIAECARATLGQA